MRNVNLRNENCGLVNLTCYLQGLLTACFTALILLKHCALSEHLTCPVSYKPGCYTVYYQA
jgi:hypothetical protein